MKDWSGGDPVLVSLVQTALFLPLMVLSLPAGVISDMFDRRRLLIYSQVWMMVAPLGLAILLLLGIESPSALLATTLLLAIGNALKLPSQSALMPALIDKQRLPMAVGLTSMAVNGGRIIGPTLAGALLPLIGAVVLFLGNSILYLLYVAILLNLPNPPERAPSPKNGLLDGLKDLAGYASKTPTYRNILLRGGLYFCAWSTVLALVPLLASDAESFGILYGTFGLGAVIGAAFYGKLSTLARRNTAITIGIAGHGIALVLLSLTPSFWIMTVLMALIGVGSFFVMTTLQVCAQSQLPDEMRGRGLALMTTVFMGATAISSPIWGGLAAIYSPHSVLTGAATMSAVAAMTLHSRKIDIE